MTSFKPTYRDIAKQGSSISCHLMTNHKALDTDIICPTYTRRFISFSFPDDAIEQRKLGIKTKTISSSRTQLNHLPIPKC